MPNEKKTENKRTIQARESKIQILKGFVELQQSRGFDGFTIAELCEYLNISVGRFYHHFKSRDELFFNIYMVWDNQLGEWIESNTETDARLNLITYSVLFARHNKDMGLPFVQKMFSGSNTNLAKKKRTIAYIDTLARAFWKQYGLDGHYTPEEVVRHVRVVTRGVIFDWAIHEGDFDIEQAMEAAVSSCLDGILTTREHKSLYYKGCDTI